MNSPMRGRERRDADADAERQPGARRAPRRWVSSGWRDERARRRARRRPWRPSSSCRRRPVAVERDLGEERQHHRGVDRERADHQHQQQDRAELGRLPDVAEALAQLALPAATGGFDGAARPGVIMSSAPITATNDTALSAKQSRCRRRGSARRPARGRDARELEERAVEPDRVREVGRAGPARTTNDWRAGLSTAWRDTRRRTRARRPSRAGRRR